MRFRFIPREEKFFDLFEQQAQNVLEGAQVLVALMMDYSDLKQKTLNISRIEHNGDEIAHDIIEKLNTTFITPMDREDIHELTSALDDIIDFIDATVERMALYKVTEPTEDALNLANLILRCVEETAQAVTELGNFRKSKHMKQHFIEIHRLENQGDTASRAAIAKLFDSHANAIDIIKWKEVYEHLETAIDKCEDAANIIEAMVLKNA